MQTFIHQKKYCNQTHRFDAKTKPSMLLAHQSRNAPVLAGAIGEKRESFGPKQEDEDLLEEDGKQDEGNQLILLILI